MKLRFPLYSKILFWFFINLLVLGIGAWWISGGHFPPELDSLVAGRAGDRVQQVVNLVSKEIHDSPHEQWDAILKRFGESYSLHFYLFENREARQLAGDSVVLPNDVRARIVERPGQPLGLNSQNGQNPPPPPNDNPPPDDNNPPPPGDRQPPGDRPPQEQSGDGNGPPPRLAPADPPPQGPHSRFMLHTQSPSLYWVIVRIPGVRSPGRPLPACIVMTSETMSAGGLFFDVKPWLEIGIGSIAVSALLWFPFVRGITHSIGQMTRATEQIAGGNFDVRTPGARRDELGSLGGAINRMAERLAGFVGGQKRFLGDIAHELCSPLARAQVALSIIEQRGDATHQAYVNDVREEIDLMSSLVNELLSFSKAALGAQIKLQPVDLHSLVEKAALRELKHDTNVQLDVPENLSVMAEPELLQRSLSNLIRNALRYAGHAGPVIVSAVAHADKVAITVSDSGPGIPPEALAQVFDPFYRVDPSRARETGGVGLGLAIVKTCAESCGGTVTARNRQPSGLEVVITLKQA